MDDQQGTIAVGVASLAVLGAIWGAVEVLSTIESDGAPELATLCSDPVEIIESGQSRLGCADDSRFASCEALAAGDRVEVGADGCEVRRGAMAASMKIHVGLPLDLNAVSAADLMLIGGIGPKLSEAIVAHRLARGGFGSLEELVEVHGIGAAKVAELRKVLVAKPVMGRDVHDGLFNEREVQ